MIYYGDERIDDNPWISPDARLVIQAAVESALLIPVLRDSATLSSVELLFTTVTTDIPALTVQWTGIGKRGVVAGLTNTDPKTNITHSYLYNGVLTETADTFTHVLLVQPELLDGIEAHVFGPTMQHETFTRVMFHELTHLIFEFPQSSTIGLDFGEELAVFAENTIYVRFASAKGWSDAGVTRYGHGVGVAPPGAVSGINSFSIYADVTIDEARSDPDRATFEASNGVTTLTKTYYKPGTTVGSHIYDHYIHLEESTSGTSYVSAQGASSTVAIRSTLTGDMMGGSAAVAGATAAANAWKAVNAVAPGLTPISITRVHGLGADAWSDTVNDITKSFSGVLTAGTGVRAATIEIDDSGATLSTLLLGASGTGTSHDVLHAGSGDDILVATGSDNELHGGGGHDVFVGTAAGDKMFGDSGTDIFVSSGGANEYNGGDDMGWGDKDTIYYGAEQHGIVVNAVLGQVQHDSGVGTGRALDSFSKIEQVVGTAFGDTFIGDGQDHTYFGGQGEDIYVAGTGADHFIDLFVSGSNANSLDFSALTSGIELTSNNVLQGGSTTDGVTYVGIGKIRGTEHADIFRMNFGTGWNNQIWGGGGDDTFYVGSYTSAAYGEAGADHFYIVGLNNNQTISGGTSASDKDVLDFSMLTGVGTIYVNMGNNTFTGSSGNTNHYYDIESFVFGANPMRITGTTGADILKTGSGISKISGGTGIDVITVTPIDEFTPQNARTYGHVDVHGGDEIGPGDIIVAHRAATIFGDAGNDDITGSDFADMIYGGAGNDIINARGGDDMFNAVDLMGIDHIDAGAGLGDNFYSGGQMESFDFYLSGAGFEEFGIQRTGAANSGNVMLFKGLEVCSFYQSYFATRNIQVSDAVTVLQSDVDHYMTGQELWQGLLALGQGARGTSGDAGSNAHQVLWVDDELGSNDWQDNITFWDTQIADGTSGTPGGTAPTDGPSGDWLTAEMHAGYLPHLVPMSSDFPLM
jgi:hypothetical protein